MKLRFFGRLWVRLLFVTVAPVLVAVLSVAVLANYVAVGQFDSYLSQDVQQRDLRLEQELARYYEEQGNWLGVGSTVNRMAALVGERIVVTDITGQVVADSTNQLIGQQQGKNWRRAESLVALGGTRVGTVWINPTLPGRASSLRQEAFLTSVNRSLLIGSVMALLVSIALAVLLSNRLRRQLTVLMRTTRQIGRGNLALRVPVSSEGDLDDLGSAVNQMAADIEQQIRARRQMVADVAHELRNPLQNINGYIEALRDGVLPADEHTLEILANETTLLRRLVDDLQDLSVAESGRLSLDVRPVSLSDLVAGLFESVRPRAEELGIELSSAVSRQLPRAMADERRLRQVLANLVSNALVYTPNGGQVRVDAAASDGVVEIAVTDTGAGISAEDQQRIFERFYRVDPARPRSTGGAGLGLTIARELVNAMKGEIGVTSTPGQGSRFWIKLPQAPVETSAPRRQRAPRAA
ncbi:MAG TPA: HAMP domain-containing sensor histidine kinase [Chloroflexota bacterium]|nr:HAMP domain-containing sensor histidine kinase [Chloroflexota bacterium]